MTEKELRARIAELPQGSLSEKEIDGRTYYYLQGSVDGKKFTHYVKKRDLDDIRRKLDEREALKSRLADLLSGSPDYLYEATPSYGHPTSVSVLEGDDLIREASYVRGWKKRDAYGLLLDFLKTPSSRPVIAAIFGLRRTGKTVMMMQAILELYEEEQGKSVYMKMNRGASMDTLNCILDRLHHEGKKYIFIDEATMIPDFIDDAALLSDIYAPLGMKIVVSGTDSLGFWIAEGDQLYDRVLMLHTTWIPFREHNRLLSSDIDSYISYGGLLREGSDGKDALPLDFRDGHAASRYIDTAIADNIQNTLRNHEDGRDFQWIWRLHESGNLTGAINRGIEDMTHRFVKEILARDFKSSDLGLAESNIRRYPEFGSVGRALLDSDRKSAIRRMMDILEIRNRGEHGYDVTDEEARWIDEYLHHLDLAADIHIERLTTEGRSVRRATLIIQPGMRFVQTKVLVGALLEDPAVSSLSLADRKVLEEKILEAARGRLLEEIVLHDADATLGGRFTSMKVEFERGEFDLVIYDSVENAAHLFEIKHSDKMVTEQARHLSDGSKLELIRRYIAEPGKRCVLYRGEDSESDGILWRNVETFLLRLPEFRKDGFSSL